MRTCPAESIARKPGQTFLEAIRLVADAAPQLRGPVALHEIVSTIEQEYARIAQMRSRPARHVQRRFKAGASVDRSDKSLLIGKHQFQPQSPEQHVSGREAMIERALWRLHALYDGIDGNGTRSMLAGQDSCGFQE